MRARQKFCLDLDWNLLKTFYGIVEANGVTSAANALWRKQSTLSLALQRLERHLGTHFVRVRQRGLRQIRSHSRQPR